jgi:hypothetical protein
MRTGSPNGESLEFISAALGVVMRAVVISRDTLKIGLDQFSSRYRLMEIHQTVHRYMRSNDSDCGTMPVCFSEIAGQEFDNDTDCALVSVT